jgi:hypothetical protein
MAAVFLFSSIGAIALYNNKPDGVASYFGFLVVTIFQVWVLYAGGFWRFG